MGQKHLSIDLGSSSCKISLVEISEERIQLKVISRFETPKIFMEGHIYLDTCTIYRKILNAIADLSEHHIEIDTLGADAWTSDFSLVRSGNRQQTLPVFYRDPCFDISSELIYSRIRYPELYRLTTQRILRESTLGQILAERRETPDLFEGNVKILFVADLIMYLFSGKVCSEISAASYSQMFDIRSEKWEDRVFDLFEIPRNIQPDIVYASDVIGSSRPDLNEKLHIRPFRIIAPAAHDTCSAVAAIPYRKNEKWAFISTGSWFLCGVETSELPRHMDLACRYRFSCTALAFHKKMLKRNVTAMWILQECKRIWDADRETAYEWSELADLAAHARPFLAYLDTDDPKFVHPENMPEALCSYLREHGEGEFRPDDAGQITRMVYENIAFACRFAFDRIGEILEQPSLDIVYIAGGAARAGLLNQMIADVLGLPVCAGLEEASSVGNGMLQALGAGEIQSEQELHDLVRNSFPMKMYHPENHRIWKEKYQIFCRFCSYDPLYAGHT